MEDKNSVMRNIPQVEKILQNEDIKKLSPLIGHAITVKIIREEIENFREKISPGETPVVRDLITSITSRCALKKLEKLQRVINGTGVIIHTNLGRSPLGEEILAGMARELSGYCNLELHLPSESRGMRGGFAEELLCEITGGEDALVVNNNASSVFLILNCFAKNREVIVSRGELIQIGGGFRIPDIMSHSGAILAEVGTTNITTLDDYRRAVTEKTAMILSAHRSNYRIQGFTESPSLADLASLKSPSLLVVRDLGSGNLVNAPETPRPCEPAVSSELAQGMDLVCFSGDKLLGGAQAGIIVGKKDLIADLRKHPMMRMLRVDKITYFILQETLLKYIGGDIRGIPVWDIIMQDKKSVARRAARVIKKTRDPRKKTVLKAVPTRSTFGGGALPAVEMDSYGIKFDFPGVKAADLYTFFINSEVPIVGVIECDRFILDFTTIFDSDIPRVVQTVDAAMARYADQGLPCT